MGPCLPPSRAPTVWSSTVQGKHHTRHVGNFKLPSGYILKRKQMKEALLKHLFNPVYPQ